MLEQHRNMAKNAFQAILNVFEGNTFYAIKDRYAEQLQNNDIIKSENVKHHFMR